MGTKTFKLENFAMYSKSVPRIEARISFAEPNSSMRPIP